MKFLRTLDFLIARVTQRGRYVVVVTQPLRSGATETFATAPMEHHSAVQNWRWRIDSGAFDAGTGRSTWVMSVSAAKKAGIR